MMKPKIVEDFEKEFGSLLWHRGFGYEATPEDLTKMFKIVNEHIFRSKLDNDIPFTVRRSSNASCKGCFGFGKNQFGKWVKGMLIVANPSGDNFFQIVNTLMHEMIHNFDYMYGKVSQLKETLGVTNSMKYGQHHQFMGSYDLHGNELFVPFMKKMNSYGFNVQKYYNARDGIFMRSVEESEKTDAVKEMYLSLDSDEYKSLNFYENGSWKIELA